MKRHIMLTGGSGYIGSHIAVELINNGYVPIIVDNFSNSQVSTIKKLEFICNEKIIYFNCDINNKESLNKIFSTFDIECVIHLAALKSIPESIRNPLMYFQNNIGGITQILKTMSEHNCNKFIYSSSCSIYNEKSEMPIKETAELKGTNPYSISKVIGEKILDSYGKNKKSFNYISLRYFNPIGSHSSGLIGDNPNLENGSLISEICKVGSKKNSTLNVYGDDYNTDDGTCIRDYIHINDLANAHVSSLDKIYNIKENLIINVGTGRGYSVKEVITTFERVNNIKIPYRIKSRRDGDIEKIYACTNHAFKELNWMAKEDLDSMCESAWKFFTKEANEISI